MNDAPTTSRDTGGEAFDVEVQFEVWQDDAMVASADSLSDAAHFMAIYGQDGPVRAVTAVTHRFDGFAAPTPRKAEGVWERVDLRNQVAHIIVQKVLQEDYDDLVEGYLDEILAAADEIILLPAYKAVAKGYYDRLAAAPTAEVK